MQQYFLKAILSNVCQRRDILLEIITNGKLS